MNRIWLVYRRHSLLVQNTVSCGLLSGFGDVCEQFITGDMKAKGWDWKSTLVLSGAGAICGPPMHLFYYFLDKFRGSHKMIVMKKLFFDTLSNPPLSALFIIAAALLEGKNLRDSTKEYTDKWWQIMKVDTVFWSTANFFNFYYLSNKYRILYINVVQAVYSIIMAHIKKKHKEEKAVLSTTTTVNTL